MQKTVLAAALAAAPLMAHAQSSVTLYGLLDGGVQHQRVKIDDYGSASATGMAQSVRAGNRWGLRGSEDLGNGLKAVFTLENGFNLNDGSAGDRNRIFNRQAFMGLASDAFGTLTLGRQYNTGFTYFGTFGAFGTGFGAAGSSRVFSSAFVRYDNMLKYETPTLHGLKGAIGYSRQANIGAGTEDVRAVMGGLLYRRGPLRMTANFDRVGNLPSQTDERGAIKAWNAAIEWSFGNVEISGLVGRDIDGRINNMIGTSLSLLGNLSPVPNAVHVDGFRADNYALGAKWKLGAGQLLVNWMMSDSNLSGVVTAGGNGTATQHTASLAYAYDLSKRTSLYAVTTHTRNVAYIDNSTASEYVVGLMHRF